MPTMPSVLFVLLYPEQYCIPRTRTPIHNWPWSLSDNFRRLSVVHVAGRLIYQSSTVILYTQYSIHSVFVH